MHCFKKIRIAPKENKEVEDLFRKRKILHNKEDARSKKEFKEIEERLNSICAEDNYKRLKEELSTVKEDEGPLNSYNLWKIKSKLINNKYGTGQMKLRV